MKGFRLILMLGVYRQNPSPLGREGVERSFWRFAKRKPIPSPQGERGELPQTVSYCPAAFTS